MGTTDDTLSSPSVGDALFGVTCQSVLRLLFGHADKRFYQRQIIGTLGLGSGTVQRELDQLVRAGILTRVVEGRQTYFQASPECPVFDELRGLVRKAFGVGEVLRDALAPMGGHIYVAFVFGSVSTGSETVTSDIDVMVVGEGISLQNVVSSLAKAETTLAREVNPSVYEAGEFRRKLSGGHHFLNSVAAGPKIFLIGDEHEFARLAEIRMAERAHDKSARNRRVARRRR